MIGVWQLTDVGWSRTSGPSTRAYGLKPRMLVVVRATPARLKRRYHGSYPHKHRFRSDSADPASAQSRWGARVSGPGLGRYSVGDAQTLALIVDDPDALFRAFTHWVIFNSPAPRNRLAAGVPQGEQPANTATQGRNGCGDIGYGGPQPPSGKPHHYLGSRLRGLCLKAGG
jgi:phosphatidylethanolamine-binding protein (PEBP) family uncharacterized protein